MALRSTFTFILTGLEGRDFSRRIWHDFFSGIRVTHTIVVHLLPCLFSSCKSAKSAKIYTNNMLKSRGNTRPGNIPAEWFFDPDTLTALRAGDTLWPGASHGPWVEAIRAKCFARSPRWSRSSCRCSSSSCRCRCRCSRYGNILCLAQYHINARVRLCVCVGCQVHKYQSTYYIRSIHCTRPIRIF